MYELKQENAIEQGDEGEVKKGLKLSKWIILGGVILLFLIALFVAWAWSQCAFCSSNLRAGEIEGDVMDIEDDAQTPLVSPTPDPFEDMTIPYLSSREYVSQLGELEQVASNGSYTSYLTSYDSDELRINGLLTIPEEEEPDGGWGAIVFIHGYIPPSTYVTTQNYSDYVDYLARRGFVVFKIDLRGHGNSEGEAGGAYYSGDYVVDALNARAALQNADFVDPGAIGLWGHSMAGNVVFRSMAASDVMAGVIWAGAVYTYEDMREYGIQDNSYRPPSEDSERDRERDMLRELHGSFDPSDPFWQKVPATNYLDNIEGALQINHAVNDPVVDIGYSRDVSELLEEAGVVHELNEYPGGGHNITGANFNAAMQDTVDFFHEYLK